MEIGISIIPGFSNARREGSVRTLSRAASLSGWLSNTIPFGQNSGAWEEPSGEKAWGREGSVDGKAVVMVKYK